MNVELQEYLKQQRDLGYKWVVCDTDNPISTKFELQFFKEQQEAFNSAKEYQQIFNWYEAVLLDELLSNLARLDQITVKSFRNKTDITINKKNMNLNNLENLKEEMKALGFKEKLIEEMAKKVEKQIPEFSLNDSSVATKGQVDFTLFFKKSGQSEFYYFNKFEVVHNQGKTLEEGQRYMVISAGENNKNIVKKLDNVTEAIAFFKEQKGESELALGKDAANKIQLATMEKGKVNYVAKDFQKSFYAPAITQTFYVEKGKGFTAEQASNLIQGRSVYRDDLLNLSGSPYKAWIKLDFDKPRDRHNNLTTNQYHDPSYGFDLKKVLEKYQIKELDTPAKFKKIEESLKNGNRPLGTVVKDGHEVKIYIEAVPRYSQINLFAENGRPEKREQYLKQISQANDLNKGKVKKLSEGKEMSM
jgi:hypothetical protein